MKKIMTTSLITALITVLISVLFITPADASVLQKLIRSAGNVADDVPIRQMDDAINPGTKKMADEVLEAEKRIQSLSRSDALIRQIERTVGRLDAPTQRALREAGEATQETALMLCRGSKNVTESIPDVLLRANFLKTVNGDTLCVLGRYGDLVGDARIVQTAVLNNMLKPDQFCKISRKVTLDDFGAFFRRTGEKGHEFWIKNVSPHKKLWIASGALATILLMPEEYTNYAIEMGADGIAKVIRIAGNAVGKMVEGVTEGVEAGVTNVVTSFFKTPTGVVLLAVLAVFAVLILWQFAIFRALVSPFIWLWKRLVELCRKTKLPAQPVKEQPQQEEKPEATEKSNENQAERKDV